MPKLENAERRERKLEKRKNPMKMHGKTSIEVIKQQILRRAEKKAKQREREREAMDDS